MVRLVSLLSSNFKSLSAKVETADVTLFHGFTRLHPSFTLSYRPTRAHMHTVTDLLRIQYAKLYAQHDAQPWGGGWGGMSHV